MKKIYPLFLSLLLLLPGIKTYCQETFQASATTSYFRDMKVAENNDVLIATDATDEDGLVVSRLLRNGKIKWSKSYSSMKYANIAGTIDNGFMVATMNRTTNTHPTYLLKCDSNGNVLWSKIITSVIVHSGGFCQVCESPDGNIYVVTLDLHTDFHVIKLDKDGAILWSKYFPYIANMWNNLSAITSGKDGGLIVMITKFACESYCSYSYIQKFDKDGNTEWGGDIHMPGVYSSGPISVFYGDNRINVILQAELDRSNQNTYCYWTFKPDKSGSKAMLMANNIFALKNILVQQNIHLPDDFTFTEGNANKWLVNKNASLLNVFQNFNYTVIKYTQYDSLNRVCPDYIIPRFDKKTSRIDISIGDNSYKESPNAVSIADFTVTASPYTITTTVICKGTAAYTATNTANKMVVLNKPTITIYPNPVGNMLFINGLNAAGKTTIQLINTNGIILKEIKATGTTTIFNMASYKPGAYFIRINDGKNLITKNFIKD